MGLAIRNCEGVAGIWATKLEFFWMSPKEKLRLNLGEDLFFWRSPHFGQKIRLKLIKIRLKSGARSHDVFSSIQNSPPPKQIPGYAPG